MIISHKYKFIFLKPRKVAGTSIEVALAAHCGPEDTITPITAFSKDIDDVYYEQDARNYKESGFYNHMIPSDIQKRISLDVWNEYTKITIVRNPWDRLVSQFHWQQSHSLTDSEKGLAKVVNKWKRNMGSVEDIRYNLKKRWRKIVTGGHTPDNSFEEFVRNIRPKYSNTPFYFDTSGNPIADMVIKYENLDDGYKQLCDTIGIPYSALPTLKTKPRKEKPHYSAMYTDDTRDIVAKQFAREIEYFHYSFEQQ